jgi:hypothetical protein
MLGHPGHCNTQSAGATDFPASLSYFFAARWQPIMPAKTDFAETSQKPKSLNSSANSSAE